MIADILKHALETFNTLEGGRLVLNVATDLPINPASPGFDAEKLDALNRELAKRLSQDGYDEIILHSKS